MQGRRRRRHGHGARRAVPVAVDRAVVERPARRGAAAGIPAPLAHMVVERLMLAMFATNSVPDMFATEGLREHAVHVRRTSTSTPTPVQTKLPVATWRIGRQLGDRLRDGELRRRARARGEGGSARVSPHACCRSRGRARRACSTRSRSFAAGARRRRRASAAASRATSRSRPRSARSPRSRSSTAASRCAACTASSTAGSRSTPTSCKAQMEGAIIFGLSAALDQEITLVDGVVQQTELRHVPGAAHVRGARDHRPDPR